MFSRRHLSTVAMQHVTIKPEGGGSIMIIKGLGKRGRALCYVLAACMTAAGEVHTAFRPDKFTLEH
jgi:hypothetical protein